MKNESMKPIASVGKSAHRIMIFRFLYKKNPTKQTNKKPPTIIIKITSHIYFKLLGKQVNKIAIDYTGLFYSKRTLFIFEIPVKRL